MLGLPTAYVGFTMWLVLREQGRTRDSENRNVALQEKVFALSQGLVTAALKNEAAINSLLRQSPGSGQTGQFSLPGGLDAKPKV